MFLQDVKGWYTGFHNEIPFATYRFSPHLLDGKRKEVYNISTKVDVKEILNAWCLLEICCL